MRPPSATRSARAVVLATPPSAGSGFVIVVMKVPARGSEIVVSVSWPTFPARPLPTR